MGDESRRRKKSIDAIYGHYRSTERKRLTGDEQASVPGLPFGVADYLNMNLELTPNEYMNTSRDIYETAVRYQNARARGARDARDEYERERKRQAEAAARLAKLKARS